MVQEDVRVSEKLLAVSIVLLIIGSVGIGVISVAETDHSHVSVAERGSSSDVDNAVAYAELPASAQVAFREAVSLESGVEVKAVSSDVEALNGVDVVTLDGVAYTVSVETGYRSTSEIVIGGVGVILAIAGIMLFNEELHSVNDELHSVFVGSAAVVGGVIALLVIAGMITFPLGWSESSVSTQPVMVDSVSNGDVIHVESLPDNKREAVYDVITGGDVVPSSEVSFTVVPELGPGVTGEYEYLQSNSEYYAVRDVSNYRWWVDAGLFAVGGLLTVVMSVAGGLHAYDTRYVRGNIKQLRGGDSE